MLHDNIYLQKYNILTEQKIRIKYIPMQLVIFSDL